MVRRTSLVRSRRTHAPDRFAVRARNGGGVRFAQARCLLEQGRRRAMESAGSSTMKKRSSERTVADLAHLTRFMSGLHEDQRKLREIQSVYDNLTLLGQLLCAGTDITSMRSDFNELAAELLDQL